MICHYWGKKWGISNGLFFLVGEPVPLVPVQGGPASRWDHSCDYRGKRVTLDTAIQVGPLNSPWKLDWQIWIRICCFISCLRGLPQQSCLDDNEEYGGHAPLLRGGRQAGWRRTSGGGALCPPRAWQGLSRDGDAKSCLDEESCLDDDARSALSMSKSCWITQWFLKG